MATFSSIDQEWAVCRVVGWHAFPDCFPPRAIDQLSHITQEAFQFLSLWRKFHHVPSTSPFRWRGGRRVYWRLLWRRGLLRWLRDSQTVKFKGGISWTRILRLAVASPPHLAVSGSSDRVLFLQNLFLTNFNELFPG